MSGGTEISLSSIAAIVGAITGPAGLLIALFSYLRDRPQLWVSVAANMRVHNSPKYSADKRYLVVTVSNIGRRPEYVTMVSLLFPFGDTALLSDTFFSPNESTEGKAPLQYLVDLPENSEFYRLWPGVLVVVRTSSGRQYRSRFILERPNDGKEYTRFERLKLRARTRLRYRWAFRRQFLD